MQNSVELRIPFLDDDFVRLALNTPIKFKMSYGLFNRYTPHTKFSFLKNRRLPYSTANFGAPRAFLGRRILWNAVVGFFIFHTFSKKL